MEEAPVESTQENNPKMRPQRFQNNRPNQPFNNRRRWNRNENNSMQNRDDYAESTGSQGRPKHPVNKLENSIRYLSETPTLELPHYDLTEKPFSAHNRLYIGNLPNEMTEEELKELLNPFGESNELFINKEKSFAFAKLQFHAEAVKARNELDGSPFKGKFIKVNLSPSTTAVKVLNLSPWVTGELLMHAFAPFGEVESAKVLVDEKGKSIFEGIVEFTRRFSATQAIQKCQERCFFLGQSIKPVIVEPYECSDQATGLLDKHISKRNQDFIKERSVGPRLADVHSFQHEYGTRWKALFEMHKQKSEALKVEFRLECEKLEAQMEYARYEHETEMLRNQLKHREMDKDRQKREWEMRERQVEEEKMRSESFMRQNRKDFHAKMWKNDQQQEELLLKQAQNLNLILETQEGLENVPSSSTREQNIPTFEPTYNDNQKTQNYSQNWSKTNSSDTGGGGGNWVNYPKKQRFY